MYELPFGRSRFFGAGSPALNKLIGGWYVSGIFRTQSGDLLVVNRGPGVWGGSLFFGFKPGAIPTKDPRSFGNTVRTGVAGSNNIGINGNPATGGASPNLFSDPKQVFNSFRRVLTSQDEHAGRANLLQGLPQWDVNLSLGKRTTVTEQANIVKVATLRQIPGRSLPLDRLSLLLLSWGRVVNGVTLITEDSAGNRRLDHL